MMLGSTRSPMSPRLSRRNLGNVLRQLGDQPPAQSLLWMSANSAHGGLQRKAMSAEELERFYSWIVRTCNETHGTSERDTNVLQASAELPQADDVDAFDPEEFNALP